MDDIPQGFDPKEFDDWLWRRQKPLPPGRPADLRNTMTFPGFTDLPNENDVDLEFYTSSDGSTYQPRRHWLFLAEIVDFATLLRLQMDVEDVHGTKIPVFFYTEERGSELAPSQVQKGFTIAILYPQRHRFLYSEPGIRHEEPTRIKVRLQLPTRQERFGRRF